MPCFLDPLESNNNVAYQHDGAQHGRRQISALTTSSRQPTLSRAAFETARSCVSVKFETHANPPRQGC